MDVRIVENSDAHALCSLRGHTLERSVAAREKLLPFMTSFALRPAIGDDVQSVQARVLLMVRGGARSFA